MGIPGPHTFGGCSTDIKRSDGRPLRRKTLLAFEEQAFLTLCTRQGSGRLENSDVYR